METNESCPECQRMCDGGKCPECYREEIAELKKTIERISTARSIVPHETKRAKIQRLAEELATIFPPKRSCNIGIYSGDYEVTIHTTSYDESVEVMRSLDVADRSKSHFESDGKILHSLRGMVENVLIKCLGSGLPPSCRIETVTRKIPKSTVTYSNDEFIEIEEKKVVCGGGQ